jgi:predicted PurR-regulated permease PerM
MNKNNEEPNNLLIGKINYLRELYEAEEQRKITIETKIQSVFTQGAFFISIISVFYATMFNSLSSFTNLVNIIIHILLIAVLSCSLISIYSSGKALDISKDFYMTGEPDTVKKSYHNIDDFLNEQINDYLNEIPNNVAINNKKGSELIYSQSWLKVSITLSFLLMLIIVIYKLLNSMC